MDRVNGIDNVRVNIVMMRTPDGHGRLELTKFRNAKLISLELAIAPPNGTRAVAPSPPRYRGETRRRLQLS